MIRPFQARPLPNEIGRPIRERDPLRRQRALVSCRSTEFMAEPERERGAEEGEIVFRPRFVALEEEISNRFRQKPELAEALLHCFCLCSRM